ncbi:baseplate J/gp47 family protein [Fusobacterium varium]|uniref:baseplate J/gp47 family protein n=1 Tax=Fusobacterium TaxID=848 RepID=UPI0030D0B07C
MESKNRIEIRNNILNDMKNENTKIEGSYNYDIAAASAISLEELYDYMTWWGKQTFITTATEDEFVDNHALIFGVTRRKDTKASGGATITGKTGTEVARGTIVLSRTGVKYETITIGYIDSKGTTEVRIQALEGGPQGNCGIGDIVSFEIANTDIYSIVNNEPVTGGFDVESNESLIERCKEKILEPAHSGNENDYKQWAREVAGVGKVDVIPVWNGGGTVKVIISNYDYEPVTNELVQAVKDHIEEPNGRPIGADVTVVSYIAYDLIVAVNLRIAEGYNIDEIKDRISADIRKGIIEESVAYPTKAKTTFVSYGKIGAIILAIDGVLDYTSLTLNGQVGSLEVEREKIVVLSLVLVTQGERRMI